MYEFIGEDNKLDITVGRIVCTDEDKFDHYSRSTSEICENINRYLQSNSYDSVRCYYETNPYIISIHIKDATPLVLSENETNLVKSYKTKSEEINFYTDLLSYAESYSDIYEDFDILDELLGSISENSSLEEYPIDKFETLIEAASIIGVDAESITAYANKYSNLIYNSSILEGVNYNSEKNMVTNIIEGYRPYTDAPMEDKVEALLITKAILSEANIDAIGKKKDDNKDNGDNGDDNKGGGINLNLNKMKLYLQGLKTKFKDMTQKEKEISKKIDSTSKVLVKSLKDALISDRREAIIKGSVIPSFSKCMKIGVALAGIAKFGHPEIAAIAAIGGFIASKKLTKKERMLLLDEIEIELDVLEKEINNAESRGQMKKYRALQTQKKSLQRQYQRIKYNVRIGKEIMPNSEIGVKTSAS